jgi:hypothetical protein
MGKTQVQSNGDMVFFLLPPCLLYSIPRSHSDESSVQSSSHQGTLQIREKGKRKKKDKKSDDPEFEPQSPNKDPLV